MTLLETVRTETGAPPLRPSPQGLIASAEVFDDLEGLRINGLSWVPESSGDVLLQEHDFCNATDLSSVQDPRAGHRDYLPFWVITFDRCSTFGGDSMQERKARAQRRLQAVESIGVEEQFERGTVTASAPNGPPVQRLNDNSGNDVEISGGTAQTPARALALLDQAIAFGKIGQGMIHASSLIGQLWYQANGLTMDGRGRWVTAGGNIVVIGQGYWGDGPGGAGGDDGDAATNPTAAWAYATDLVQLHRGEIGTWPDSMSEATDRAENTTEFWSARPWAIQWSRLLHAAVQITVT